MATKPDRDASDVYDAWASLWRDLTTFLAIVFAFLAVLLSLGNVNTNWFDLSSINHQHPILFPVTVGIGVALIITTSLMVIYDTKKIMFNRRATKKSS